MEGIRWFEIDWITVQWIIFGIFLVIIIILRIIRRMTRWGNIKLSHIHKETQTNSEFSFNKYKYVITNNNDSTQIINQESDKTNILIVPSLYSLNNSKIDHLASALTFFNKDVIVLNEFSLLNLSNKQSGENYLSNFLNQKKIEDIILFDWSIVPFLRKIDNEECQRNLNIIIIRPIYNLKSILKGNKFMFFTSRWFYIKKLRKFYKKLKINKTSIQNGFDEKNFIDLINKFSQKNHKFLIIDADKNLEKEKKNKSLQLLEKPIRRVIIEGGWTFYRQETIMVAHIISFLQTPTENYNKIE